MVREVVAEGGSARLSLAEGRVYLLDLTAEPGYQPENTRAPDDSIVVRFVGDKHVSTIRATATGDNSMAAAVTEEYR
jgi:ribosome biogenesis SPOUT family RNA methylase Rps3